ncbi:hypothetical protein [Massilia luteola]|jgi:hypothetical protein|uniref:hypothetical protein n=1 Tax=Massilia luteola TaxID=3081751 RepID=UPI002ACBDA33|nr:hypothetical protein [Massilia sp. Gc5]
MSDIPFNDESIPVLTEVVAETAPAPAADVPADADTAAPEPRELDDDAWRTLEERIVARVLDRLQDRVELVLEDQVRSSMAPVLDHVVTRLATELRDGLQLTVEQVVARAVAQELAHLRTRG